jgi:hypothetical protein
VKAPRRKTRQINIESKAEICDETKRIIMPKTSKIQRIKGAVFQDVEAIIELERSVKSVGIDPEPKEQDQEKTGSCG